MQPDFPPSEDPQVLESEFDIPVLDTTPDDVAIGDSVELFDAPAMLPGTPCWGVACVEGIPDGADPKRMWAPGSLVFAPTPFPFKFQPAEDEGHEGAVVSGRVDAIWRDGALIRWMGCMDSAGEYGAEAERLIQGDFMRGVSIMADDVTEADIEYVYPPPPDPSAVLEVDGQPVAAVDPMGVECPEPNMMIMHHGRVRSITMVAEPAWVECTVSLGPSPFLPPMAPDVSPLAELDALAAQAEAPMPVAAPLVAAGYTINIPELWPESWFAEPTPEMMSMVSSGAVHITPEGRVWGLLAPARVGHRAFRAVGRDVQVPRGIDYSEWQNKACIVAGADGGVYKINAGTVTFGCGHASPTDPRRADPNWAAEHYENSCSVAMRARVGENRYGTWFAGGLAHGLTAGSFEQIMGCALSGDWQGGRLKAALLVPCEGFPVAVTASVREKMGTLVASSVPIRFEEPEPDRSMDWAFALVASARFDELAAERFDEIAAERG